jgi:hypothetical protein
MNEDSEKVSVYDPLFVFFAYVYEFGEAAV